MRRTSGARSLQKPTPRPRGARLADWHSHSLPRPDGWLQQTVVKLPLSGTAQCIICLMLSPNGSLTPLFLIVFDYPRTSHSLPHAEFPRGSHPFHASNQSKPPLVFRKSGSILSGESFLGIHIALKDREWKNGCGFSQLQIHENGRGGRKFYLTQTFVRKSNYSPLYLYYLGLIVLLGL